MVRPQRQHLRRRPRRRHGFSRAQPAVGRHFHRRRSADRVDPRRVPRHPGPQARCAADDPEPRPVRLLRRGTGFRGIHRAGRRFPRRPTGHPGRRDEPADQLGQHPGVDRDPGSARGGADGVRLRLDPPVPEGHDTHPRRHVRRRTDPGPHPRSAHRRDCRHRDSVVPGVHGGDRAVRGDRGQLGAVRVGLLPVPPADRESAQDVCGGSAGHRRPDGALRVPRGLPHRAAAGRVLHRRGHRRCVGPVGAARHGGQPHRLRRRQLLHRHARPRRYRQLLPHRRAANGRADHRVTGGHRRRDRLRVPRLRPVRRESVELPGRPALRADPVERDQPDRLLPGAAGRLRRPVVLHPERPLPPRRPGPGWDTR